MTAAIQAIGMSNRRDAPATHPAYLSSALRGQGSLQRSIAEQRHRLCNVRCRAWQEQRPVRGSARRPAALQGLGTRGAIPRLAPVLQVLGAGNAGHGAGSVQIGTARATTAICRNGPKCRPSNESGTPALSRMTSPARTAWQPCQLGSGRPPTLRSRAIVVSVPDSANSGHCGGCRVHGWVHTEAQLFAISISPDSGSVTVSLRDTNGSANELRS